MHESLLPPPPSHPPWLHAISRVISQVWLYVHESVPGASVDAFLPKELYFAWQALEAKGTLSRYTLPVSTLEQWTRRMRRSLSMQK